LTLRILIVDDEHLIANSLADVLAGLGYDTLAVYSGKEALKAAAVSNPDVLLSDIVMPELDGIELGIQIRRMLPACRIILFSGYPMAEDARLKSHKFEIVEKPIRPMALLAYLAGVVTGSK
jgi:CheY-like chemotaxis protein